MTHPTCELQGSSLSFFAQKLKTAPHFSYFLELWGADADLFE
jgi:hypothetical protein